MARLPSTSNDIIFFMAFVSLTCCDFKKEKKG
jgi:hypothetical protein